MLHESFLPESPTEANSMRTAFAKGDAASRTIATHTMMVAATPTANSVPTMLGIILKSLPLPEGALLEFRKYLLKKKKAGQKACFFQSYTFV